MVMNAQRNALDAGMSVLNMIWVAMLVSVLFYLVAGFVLGQGAVTGGDDSGYRVLRGVLYGVSLVTLGAIGPVRRRLASAGGPAGPSAGSGVRRTVRDPALARYLVAMLVTWALAESIAVYGMVLFILTGNRTDLYLLNLAAFAVMVYHRPKRDELVRLSRDLRRARACT